MQWHDANEIKVSVNDSDYSLQEAINGGLLCAPLPPTPPVCVSDCACAPNTLVGTNCVDKCGVSCPGTKPLPPTPPVCVPSCACAANTLERSTCSDGCGGSCPGTKPCSTDRPISSSASGDCGTDWWKYTSDNGLSRYYGCVRKDYCYEVHSYAYSGQTCPSGWWKNKDYNGDYSCCPN